MLHWPCLHQSRRTNPDSPPSDKPIHALETMNILKMPSALPQELSLLGEHVQRCADATGAWHRLRCATEAIDSFLAPRFVTTLALTLVVLAGTFILV